MTSATEYFRYEHAALERHELRNGKVVELEPCTATHSLINVNWICELGNRLKWSESRVYSSSLRIGIPELSFYTYPDLQVIRGRAELDPIDEQRGTVTNPAVIIEIFSPGTEADKRGEKFHSYRRLTSLMSYVLVSETKPIVHIFERQPDESWIFQACKGLGTVVKLTSLGITIPVQAIYSDIDLPTNFKEES